MIRWFHFYKRWHNPRSRLLLVGSHAGFERYIAMLHQFIARIGVTDIYFQGHVTNEELVAYYELADVFLCASEHEGFCVPLIEAFHMGVPVIAYAAAAVPATMDGGGILFTDKNPAEVAALIDALVTNEAFTDRVVRTQEDALAAPRGRGFRRHGAAFRRLASGVSHVSAPDDKSGLLGAGQGRRGTRRRAGTSPRVPFRRCRSEGAIGDGEPMGSGGAQGRCDRRQRATRPASPATSGSHRRKSMP